MIDPEQLLGKDNIRRQLLDAALFLLAYELLRSSIVEGVKEFFCDGFGENGSTYSDEYYSKVLPRAKHVFEASLIFLVEVEAISEDEKTKIQALREHRNEVAHDIPSAIFEVKKRVDLGKLQLAGQLLHKIDNFWGRVEADVNPDFENEEIDYEGITSIRSEVYKYIEAVARDDT